MPETRVIAALTVVTVLAAIGGFMTASETRSSTFLHALSMGIVVSAIFYFIIVWIPARQRKARIHRNLQKQYNSFKLSCISTFLIASNSQDYEPPEMLLHQEEFRRYFKMYITADQTRWHAVMNALEGNVYPL